MKTTISLILCVTFHSSAVLADDFARDRQQNWHQWRGPSANGVSPHGDPPVDWDEDSNIKWKVEVPGRGSSTPIVWGNQVFLLSAIKTDRVAESLPKLSESPTRGGNPFGIQRPTNFYEFVVLCFDRQTGKIRWQQTAAKEVPHEGHHRDHGFATASPTTDGRYLYTSFGSHGCYCYDLEGNLQWQRDLGDMQIMRFFGESISPVIHGDSLIVNWDHEGQSFLVALNAETGETKWQVDRDAGTAWSTPLLVTHDGRTQIVINGQARLHSYDLATGELIWECDRQRAAAIPSPVSVNGLVFCMIGYPGKALQAIPLDSTGDLTGTDKFAWSRDRGTPYVPSPLLYDDRLYFTSSNSAILSCLHAATGKSVIENKRLPNLRKIYGSPVGAAERIYIVGRAGTTLVIKHGAELEVLATNKLDDSIDASPAIVGKELFLRGEKFLYCISADRVEPDPKSAEAPESASVEVVGQDTVADPQPLQNPIVTTSASIARGKILYRSTCVDCHSFDGTGRDSDVTDNATDLTDDSQWVSDGSDAATYLAIRDGVGDEMPGFKDDFKDEKLMWHMVNYLRSLRK